MPSSGSMQAAAIRRAVSMPSSDKERGSRTQRDRTTLSSARPQVLTTRRQSGILSLVHLPASQIQPAVLTPSSERAQPLVTQPELETHSSGINPARIAPVATATRSSAIPLDSTIRQEPATRLWDRTPAHQTLQKTKIRSWALMLMAQQGSQTPAQ